MDWSHFSQISLTWSCPARNAISDIFLTSSASLARTAIRYAPFSFPHCTNALIWGGGGDRGSDGQFSRHQCSAHSNSQTPDIFGHFVRSIFHCPTKPTHAAYNMFLLEINVQTFFRVAYYEHCNVWCVEDRILIPWNNTTMHTLLRSLINIPTNLSTCFACKKMHIPSVLVMGRQFYKPLLMGMVKGRYTYKNTGRTYLF